MATVQDRHNPSRKAKVDSDGYIYINGSVNVIGSLIPNNYDYIALTYVASGNGVGEVETVTYKTGGASGSTVATLTLSYNASNDLSGVVRS